MQLVKSGLDRLSENVGAQQRLKGNLGYLCHSASVDQHLNSGIDILSALFPGRLVKLFGPQHGFLSDVQDNMVETDHSIHPYYQIPVYSLYSETHRPTEKMLQGIDTLIVDLQDVGTRIYTYLTTMIYCLEECEKLGIHVFVLDRPNPIGGEIVEGNILDMDFSSFVGALPIPTRHALTMGELAHFAKDYLGLEELELEVIPMEGWRRNMYWRETALPWINPSPNLPTPEGALTFPGTVIFEGTNISEGRGTTRSLEQVGHPKLDPFSLTKQLKALIDRADLEGVVLRPVSFRPMFQKHAGKNCHGHFIHVTDPTMARTWFLGQLLLQLYAKTLGNEFQWKTDGYEYKYDRPAIDYINGTDKLRKWVENHGDVAELRNIEEQGRQEYLVKRNKFLLYH